MDMLQERVHALHESPQKVCIVSTGAGAGCQNLIAQVPGSSATILEGLFPYSTEALEDFLGHKPKQFASEDTALKMAARAWRRATEIVVRRGEDPCIAVGVAVTGVIASTRPMRGEHRVFVAVRTVVGFFTAHVKFRKDKDNLSLLGRRRESELSDIFALNMILHCAGIPQVPVYSDALDGDLVKGENGELQFCPREVVCAVGGEIPNSSTHVLFDGSFNPLHFGHERIAREVQQISGKKVMYVITNQHPDKGQVVEDVLHARLSQFDYLAPVMATYGLRLYVDKARAYPGFSFIIGADTLRVLLDSKYGVPPEAVLKIFEESQTHFFVADRHDEKGTISLSDLRNIIPDRFRGMFTQLATTARISSTAVRGIKK